MKQSYTISKCCLAKYNNKNGLHYKWGKNILIKASYLEQSRLVTDPKSWLKQVINTYLKHFSFNYYKHTIIPEAANFSKYGSTKMSFILYILHKPQIIIHDFSFVSLKWTPAIFLKFAACLLIFFSQFTLFNSFFLATLL